MISSIHILGVLLTVGALLVVSWWSGRRVNDAKSFITGGTSGTWLVGGALLGTMAGGQSTIGTAQLAFCYGISAWWFTLGAAIGSLLLGYVYSGPLRRSGCTTLLEVVRNEYGRKAETLGSVLCMVGIFISIVSQVLSSGAMISSFFSIPMLGASVLGAVLIMLFVFFGGIRSAGASGIVKLILLYFSSLAAGIVVWHIAGGFTGLRDGVESIYQQASLSKLNNLSDIESIHQRYGSLVARGVMKDLGGCLSLVLGVVSTQTYAQCIWSASANSHARRGSLICAICLPVIGAACTMVGIYMRGHYVTASELTAMQQAGEVLPAGIGVIENSAQAFPAFILRHLPSWLGGIMLGTLLINILGCGSGLSLGVATILVRDVYSNLQRGAARWSQLVQMRLSIVAVLIMAVVVALLCNNSFINDLGFLSLGLRAVSILFPISFALWLPGRFKPRQVLLAMPIGVIAMLAAKLLSLPGDAVYYGLTIELLVILFHSRLKPSTNNL
ncbi:MAG: sodium:solute symporter family protein [Muribaculaceae bacterium]|nr:sodium:solute symporter family protein [Muribaculaceae bacterium]MBQ3910879.1 sodium:solute symporter family protein [Muribaculaceae bacterium]